MQSHKIKGSKEIKNIKNAANISENNTEIKTETSKFINGIISPKYLFCRLDNIICKTPSIAAIVNTTIKTPI